MRCVPFTVSFDALATLIQITGGVGHQYRTAFATFLRQHGIDLDTACPSASTGRVETVALRAIRDEMNAERVGWTTTENPKEMPTGGSSDAAAEQFWSKVFARTFQNPSLFEGASPAAVEQITSLWTTEAASMQGFVRHLVFDIFGSTKAHSWLPEGLRTVQSLRLWNQERLQHLDSSPAAAPMLVLAASPFVVSNMDTRVRSVFAQLGAFEPGDGGEPPLLSRVIVASDIGLAKPSPAGLLAGVRDIAAARRAKNEPGELAMRFHVHVGDAEADRIACEKAGCIYVECDAKVGATWEKLRATLEEMEAAL